MGKSSRDKGRRGQLVARHMLESRGYNVAELNSGTSVCDFIVTIAQSDAWAVEVKNTVTISVAHRKQAQEQAKKHGARWMLLSKISGTNQWLVQRQGQPAVVWEEVSSDV